MLYTEIKAEKEFLTLISATMSHELRNPLNSLIAQITLLENCLDTFKQLINMVRDGEFRDSDLVDKFTDLYSDTEKASKQILTPTKFIDYFIHDVLDYTVLKKNKDKFIKNLAVFKVQEVFEEVMKIMKDKI